MSQSHETNPELQLAHDFVRHTNCNIFLTGKAGTGKTTFLHNLRDNLGKRMVVTAPTGVAAINAGGMTLHSFFQIPLGTNLPGSGFSSDNGRSQFRFSRQKLKIIQSMNLLIIDEISMVRADLLDSVDTALRRLRRSRQPFGGVQLLMIGDLHQLPPVVKQDEWELIREHYDSPYFFSSNALKRTEMVTVELKHIFRQSDQEFIEILNRVRDNRLDQYCLQALNQRFIEGFSPTDDQGYITLTTHNRIAESINQSRLQNLKDETFTFTARVSGDFPQHLYPAASELVLKKGAQVMFIRNDFSPARQYYNGKIGHVTRVTDKEIVVSCPGDAREITVEPAVWENIKYDLNPQTLEIEKKVTGEFHQYPLKLAWAITIHKSQGLTFERAVIDAGAAFAHGQIYVALSRCKTLEGLVLTSPLTPRGPATDSKVQDFTIQARQNPPSLEKLQTAKISYQHDLLLECFDLSGLQKHLQNLLRSLDDNPGLLRVDGVQEMPGMGRNSAGYIFEVSEIFSRELKNLFDEHQLPQDNELLQQRLQKASAWFQERLQNLLVRPLGEIKLDSDNRELLQKAEGNLLEVQKELHVKLAGIMSCEKGFSSQAYLQAVSRAEVDFDSDRGKKKSSREIVPSDIEHPELFKILKKWRLEKAREKNIAVYQVLHQQTLVRVVNALPCSRKELLHISGIGRITADKFGSEIIAAILEYMSRHDILKPAADQAMNSLDRDPADLHTRSLSATRQTTLALFKEGKGIHKIAEERGLAPSTIEEHLSTFIETGEVDISQVMDSGKQQNISRVLQAVPEKSLGQAKRKLGDAYSYGEIKMVMAHLRVLNKQDAT